MQVFSPESIHSNFIVEDDIITLNLKLAELRVETVKAARKLHLKTKTSVVPGDSKRSHSSSNINSSGASASAFFAGSGNASSSTASVSANANANANANASASASSTTTEIQNNP
jgi:hypothetical protein